MTTIFLAQFLFFLLYSFYKSFSFIRALKSFRIFPIRGNGVGISAGLFFPICLQLTKKLVKIELSPQVLSAKFPHHGFCLCRKHHSLQAQSFVFLLSRGNLKDFFFLKLVFSAQTFATLQVFLILRAFFW